MKESEITETQYRLYTYSGYASLQKSSHTKPKHQFSDIENAVTEAQKLADHRQQQVLIIEYSGKTLKRYSRIVMVIEPDPTANKHTKIVKA